MLPRVILHTAVSLDGRIDWIDVDLAQFYGVASSFGEDATLAGSKTILSFPGSVPDDEQEISDAPQKIPHDPRPLLVVPDSRGRVRNWTQLRSFPYWRDMVALCSNTTPGEYLDYLQRRHVDCIITGEEQVDLRCALEELNRRYGVLCVRVDSGGTLSGVLLREGLVDEVSLMICPCLVGGRSPSSFYRAPDLASADGVVDLELNHVERLEGDVLWLRYLVAR